MKDNIDKGKKNYQNIDEVKQDYINKEISKLDLLSKDERSRESYLLWVDQEILQGLKNYCQNTKITPSAIINKIIVDHFTPKAGK